MRVAPSARDNSWEDVADLSASLGMPLDDWQEQVLEAAMGERSDGRWASKFVGVSAPRQNGKSQLIVARALAGVLLFGEKMVIISAHETDTAREVWKRLVDVIEDNPTLKARVTDQMNAINRESLSFGYGAERQTIKLKARRASGSRGFSADCLLLDEAQILGKPAWGSIVPTMSAMPNPQLWLFGTPPTGDDDPFAFARVRNSAQAKKARHCWLEWSASKGDDFDDPETWAKANPAYGVRISYEACADDRSAMDDEQFARERLGMWDETEVASSVLPTWPRLVSAGPDDGIPPTSLAVDASHDRVVAVAACWLDPEEILPPHVELVALDRDDSFAAVEWLVERAGRRIPVLVDGMSPAASMVSALRARKVKVNVTSAADMAKACGLLLDEVTLGALTHAGQSQLDDAVAGARKRKIGDAGGWGWDRKSPESNIAPLVAVTLARFGASLVGRRSTGRGVSDRRRAVLL